MRWRWRRRGFACARQGDIVGVCEGVARTDAAYVGGVGVRCRFSERRATLMWRATSAVCGSSRTTVQFFCGCTQLCRYGTIPAGTRRCRVDSSDEAVDRIDAHIDRERGFAAQRLALVASGDQQLCSDIGADDVGGPHARLIAVVRVSISVVSSSAWRSMNSMRCAKVLLPISTDTVAGSSCALSRQRARACTSLSVVMQATISLQRFGRGGDEEVVICWMFRCGYDRTTQRDQRAFDAVVPGSLGTVRPWP